MKATVKVVPPVPVLPDYSVTLELDREEATALYRFLYGDLWEDVNSVAINGRECPRGDGVGWLNQIHAGLRDAFRKAELPFPSIEGD